MSKFVSTSLCLALLFAAGAAEASGQVMSNDLSKCRSGPSTLVQINGLIVDVRSMPREVQEEAYRRGLIPYLPEPKARQDNQP